MVQFTSPHRNRARRRTTVALCSVFVFGVALAGCSSDDNNGKLEELQRQLDMEQAARMSAEQERDGARASQTAAEEERDAETTSRMAAEAQLATLRAQVDTLMGRADISPEDLAMLRAQVETLMGRADISPEDLDALRIQVESLMDRAAAAEQALAALPFNSAVVNAIEKVAVWGLNVHVDQESGLRENSSAWFVTGQAYSDSGSNFATISQTHREGDVIAFALPFRDENGDLQISVESGLARGSLDDEVGVFVVRRIWTNLEEREGATSSSGPIEDHGLGAEWRGFELTKAYDEDGVWTVRLFSNVAESDVPAGPYTDHELAGFEGYERDILLNDDRVYIPHGRDALYIIIPEGGLQGSLDGVDGTFSCAGVYCTLVTNADLSGYIPWVDSQAIRFTPADGTTEVLLDIPELVTPSSPIPKVNLLSFGSWLYAPEDTNYVRAFDFGVFAGGDDPFAAANLVGLTGTAGYEGKAAGTYAEILHPRTESFTADVAFTADFDFLSEEEFNGMTGRLSNFNLESGNPSPVSALSLASEWWQVDIPGGRILGSVSSSDGNWQGIWGGRFYGNDPADSTAHPTAFAGTFGADDDIRLFAGSFGARQE